MAYVNIVTSDRRWILERLATEIAARLPYARFTGVVDPRADIQYYVTFATWKRRVSPVEVGYFAHQEEDPATARKFIEIAGQMDHCVCHARLYEQVLRDHGVSNVTTIPPGVDLAALKPVVKIGVVGRTYHTGRKGEALVQQVMDLPGLEWHFTGEGWPGAARHIPEDGMAAFYNEMDYILVPALYEGGPMCVPEALACGTPVIAPTVGWVSDFPHISYRTGDASDLRRVLQALIAERATLRAAVEPYTWDRWAASHDALFRALAEARGLGALEGPPAAQPAPRRLTVALALHGSERSSLGGPSVRVPETAARLRDLGHDAQAVFFPDPAILSADLVHGYNAWSPDTALAMARLVRRAGKRFVFSPIYLDLGEQAFWNRRMLEGLASAATAEDVAQRYPILRQAFEHDRRGGGVPAEPRPGYHAMVREMIGLADHVICLSEHERAALAAIGAAPRVCSIIPNPVDAGRFAKADPSRFRAETGLSDFVLCVARVEPRKNQLLLLEALRETDLPVVLIGGETNPAYSRLIEHYAGDRLHRLGRIDPSSDLIASAMAAARVVTLPSWCEGAPLAALEAAACGAKMVLSDRSSERAYFGALARYCDPADIGSIRDAVLAAWDAPWAKADREALLGHVATHYSWEKHVEATLDVHAAVLRAPAAPLPALLRE